MKLFKMLLAIGVLAGMNMVTIGCSMDMNNPTPSEWDVQIVGDSVFDLSGDIQKVLKIKSGETYKDRSVSGAKIAAIQSQLNTALKRTTLQTVIADGGANDILQGSMDCNSDPLTQGCLDVIDYIADKTEYMLGSMYSKSPNYCVWLGYYHVKGSEIEKNEAIDYTYTDVYPGIFGPYEPSDITGVKYCYVDPRDVIKEVDIKSDNIHPTYSGSEKLATLIWNKMVEKDMYR